MILTTMADGKKVVTSRLAKLPFGWVRVFWYQGRVIKVALREHERGPADNYLARQIESLLKGERKLPDFKVAVPVRSSFTRRVLNRCARIGFGQIMSYGELARAAGKPNAARAVGQIMANNQLPLFFPCHRVVAADGRLGGFNGGLKIKRRLLEFEGWRVEGQGWHARVVR
jgi:methylated-DNA-[protein]-cysteine S-methyltransferase